MSRRRDREPSSRGFRRAKGNAAIVAAACLAGCTPVFPPIADGGSDSAFKAAIATQYGPGRPARALRERLEGEGFAIGPSAKTDFRYAAVRTEPNLPCFSLATVDWNEDGRGRVTLIQAARLPCR